MEVLNPIGIRRASRSGASASIDDLAGKRVGLLSNGWRSMEAMMPRMAELITQRWQAASVSAFHIHINKGITAAELGQLKAQCDVAIVGIAN
jgi:TRAP-type uncharacterized transport system substrate-binding protein